MAKITIQNEEGQNLNRYKMTQVAGQTNVFDLERAANITKQGTPFSPDTMGHYVQNEDVADLSTAVQSATVGGAAVPKSGTTLQLPAYPTALPASGGTSADCSGNAATAGTANYARYSTSDVTLITAALRNELTLTAAPTSFLGVGVSADVIS